MLIGGHAGIAERTEEDGVELIAEHFDRSGGKRDIFAEKFVGAPVEVDEFDGTAVFRGGGLDGFDGDGRYFLADPVAGDDGDARAGAAVAEGNVGQCRGSGWRSAVRWYGSTTSKISVIRY